MAITTFIVCLINTAPQLPSNTKETNIHEKIEENSSLNSVVFTPTAKHSHPISNKSEEIKIKSAVSHSTTSFTSIKETSAAIAKPNEQIDSNCDCLAEAYPNFIKSVTRNKVKWTDGSQMKFDDYIVKSAEEKIAHPDLQDQALSLYPIGKPISQPSIGEDPGRIRYTPFFKKIYGSTKEEVRANLDTVYWLKQNLNIPLMVTRVNGVNKKLQAISNELEGRPELIKYLVPPAGTFNWRVILNTDRLSAHSFGIAIDINVKYSNYWAWSKTHTYQNQIPWEVVEIFERYNFIWGGKWYHYDTMHFEYRPELFICNKDARKVQELNVIQ